MSIKEIHTDLSQAVELHDEAARFSEGTTQSLQEARDKLGELFDPVNNDSYTPIVNDTALKMREVNGSISLCELRITEAGGLISPALATLGREIRMIMELEVKLQTEYGKLLQQSDQIHDLLDKLRTVPAVSAGGIVEFIMVDMEKMANASGELTEETVAIIPSLEAILGRT